MNLVPNGTVTMVLSVQNGGDVSLLCAYKQVTNWLIAVIKAMEKMGHKMPLQWADTYFKTLFYGSRSRKRLGVNIFEKRHIYCLRTLQLQGRTLDGAICPHLPLKGLQNKSRDLRFPGSNPFSDWLHSSPGSKKRSD